MKLFRFFVIIIVASTTLLAQSSKTDKTEWGFSGSYQKYSTSGSSSSSGAVLISTRLGFFVYEGLEVEPELLGMLSSGSDPVYMFNGNVSYNFNTTGMEVPFLLVGYGLANTVPFFNVPFTRTDFGVGVLNLGAGMKMFLKEDIALRVEYRFQKFTGEGETTAYGSYSYTQKVDTRIHTVQIGISIFL